MKGRVKPRMYHVHYSDGNGHQARLGAWDTAAEAWMAVEKDRKEQASPDTFGGLIDWGPQPSRTYYVWEAKGWAFIGQHSDIR